MIKTYIYGTPKGFNLYEKDSEAASDFQLFYSTSRRRKRMMVQRMPSGVTRYNYLQYDVTDSGGRPHGFFGMTLQVDGFEFSPDLKTIYAWFEHLFYNKILKETSLFSVLTNEFGAVTGLKYNVSFFAQNSSEVEMVKSVLPNIFAEKGGLPLIQYDDSYGVGAHAEIAGLNPEEDPEIIETAFKKYSWVSLSEKYALLSAGTSTPSVELDYGDLKKQAGVYKDELLLVATGQEKNPTGKLGEIKVGIEEILEKIAIYAQGLPPDSDEFKSFEDLYNEYNNLSNTLSSFEHRPTESGQAQDSDSTSDFVPEPPSSSGSTQGSTQETPPGGVREQTKVCARCHRSLHVDEFPIGGTSCRRCIREMEESAKRKKIIQAFVASVIVILLVVGAVCFFIPDKEKEPIKVDVERFEQYIAVGQYDEALALIAHKEDSADYCNKVKVAIKTELNALEEKKDMEGLSSRLQSLDKVLDSCGLSVEKSEWKKKIEEERTAKRSNSVSKLTMNERNDYYIMVGNKKYDKSATISIEAQRSLNFSCDARYKLVTYLKEEGKITDFYVLSRENNSKINILHDNGNIPCVIALDHNGKRVLHLTVKPAGRNI